MADQTSDDEVFDFSNVEFTQEDLVSALNDMVKEYRKLSQSFEEAKAENISNVIYDCFESITFDDQNSPKLNENGKAGIGFSKPENSKPSWLKNKLDKDKAKSGRKPFIRQSGPRPDPRLLRQTALEVLTRSARSDSPRKTRPERNSDEVWAAAAAWSREESEGGG
ncbi:hypothetical protein F511_43650 [Dorcoceras hygrometricum]|uniref:Uncharacterized protein n=1 Tax=Dorcoceras hygrometricum TaxID=472368 RepID=A0A2Z7CHF6_9LAMI|nr:hypothetical protein F511_43650 [Dorcoceras hygrometricum]